MQCGKGERRHASVSPLVLYKRLEVALFKELWWQKCIIPYAFDIFSRTFRINRAHSAGGPGVGEGPQEQSEQDKQVGDPILLSPSR